MKVLLAFLLCIGSAYTELKNNASTKNSAFIDGKHYIYSRSTQYYPLDPIEKDIINKTLQDIRVATHKEGFEKIAEAYLGFLEEDRYKGCCFGAALFFLAHPEKTELSREDKKKIAYFQVFNGTKFYTINRLDKADLKEELTKEKREEVCSFLQGWKEEIEAYVFSKRGQRCKLIPHDDQVVTKVEKKSRNKEEFAKAVLDVFTDYYVEKGHEEFMVSYYYEHEGNMQGHTILVQLNKKRIIDHPTGIFYYDKASLLLTDALKYCSDSRMKTILIQAPLDSNLTIKDN